MHLDLSSLSPPQTYATITQTIVPRPVAWILTENEGGDYNLAPFSYFNALCSDPAIVVVSLGIKPEGEFKDTRRNLQRQKECVIHIAHREMAATVTATAATTPHSEVSELNLALEEMPGSKLPRLADCRVAYAATLVDTKMIKSHWVAFLELSDLYLDESVVSQDEKGRLKVMADKLDPLARLGGGEFMMAGEIVHVDRPA